MKNKIMLLAATVLLLSAVSLAPAQKVGRDPNGPIGKGNKPVKLRPDLKVGMPAKPTDKTATVTIFNKCKGSAAATRVRMSIYQGTAFLRTMEMDVPPLAPGAKTEVTFQIPASDSKIKTLADKSFKIEVDPYNKIQEASEGNNWWKSNEQPFPDKGGYCDPPYDN